MADLSEFLRRLAVALLGIAIPIAVHPGEIHGYPATWPPVSITGEGKCPQLTGVYSYFGETSDRESPFIPKLDSQAFRRAPIRGRPQAVKIEQGSDANINVQIVGTDLTPGESVSFKQETLCDGGWHLITMHHSGGGEGMSHDWAVRIGLGTAADGSLVVRYEYDVTSSFLLFFHDRRRALVWYRFPPANLNY